MAGESVGKWVHNTLRLGQSSFSCCHRDTYYLDFDQVLYNSHRTVVLVRQCTILLRKWFESMISGWSGVSAACSCQLRYCVFNSRHSVRLTPSVIPPRAFSSSQTILSLCTDEVVRLRPMIHIEARELVRSFVRGGCRCRALVTWALMDGLTIR